MNTFLLRSSRFCYVLTQISNPSGIAIQWNRGFTNIFFIKYNAAFYQTHDLSKTKENNRSIIPCGSI